MGLSLPLYLLLPTAILECCYFRLDFHSTLSWRNEYPDKVALQRGHFRLNRAIHFYRPKQWASCWVENPIFHPAEAVLFLDSQHSSLLELQRSGKGRWSGVVVVDWKSFSCSDWLKWHRRRKPASQRHEEAAHRLSPAARAPKREMRLKGQVVSVAFCLRPAPPPLSTKRTRVLAADGAKIIRGSLAFTNYLRKLVPDFEKSKVADDAILTTSIHRGP